MELYAQVLNYAIPFFVVLIGIEYWVGRQRGVTPYMAFDTISSLSSGLTNTIKDVLGLTIVIVSYTWLYDHIALFTFANTWWFYIIAFIGLDFAGYWSHRLEHQINILWNRHIIHHSSEEFNLACALRQPISTVFALFFFLLIPTALMGVPPEVIAIVAPLHLFAQFWYHTQLIGKMGWLETWLVTPSHHRVHHAINQEYLDKNFSQVFIVWDRWFGTFQQELADVPAVYGVKRAVKTWNPFLINIQHLWLIITDTWRASRWIDKLRVWVMPTGWRPQDVANNYPVDYVEHAIDQVKYQTRSSPIKVAWSWTQFIITLLLTGYLFNTIADHTFGELLIYALFLMLTIFSYTSVMDQSMIAIPAEVLKIGVTIYVLVTIGDWFGIDSYLPYGSGIVIGYVLLSLVVTLSLLMQKDNTLTPLTRGV